MLVYEHIAAWEKKATNVVCVLLIVGAAVILIVGSLFPMVTTAFFGVVLLCAYFVVLIRVIAPDMMRKVLPVPDEFYKPLGVFNATVRNVAPHVVEVETDSGAVLFADADRVPEVAHFRGARVEVDAAVVTSPAGQGDVRADGVGGFVDARKCQCTAGYGADVAMGDEPRGKWGGKARFYAVTAVRAAD